MSGEQPVETRRQFLSRSGALIAGLAGLPFVPPAVAESVEPSGSLNLGLERAFVLFELRLFERHYLPGLHAPFSLAHSDAEPRLCFCQSKEYRLEQWQVATRRLAKALTAPHCYTLALGPDEIRPLFSQPCPDSLQKVDHSFMLDVSAHRCFSVAQGRICWHIYPLGSIRPEPEHRACDALHLLKCCFGLPLLAAPEAANACEQLRSLLPQIKELYRRLDPLGDAHFVAYEWLLPLLVEVDLAWVVQVLDRSRMEHVVARLVTYSPVERDQRLHALRCPFVSNYLSSAHTLVMGSLANNHFCEIANLFGHPEIFGSANSLMAEIIFAVLHRKVKVLRQLTKHCNF